MLFDSMGKKLSPKERELYRRTDEILHFLWDPCGISDLPQARDEYSNYLPQVFQLVRKSSTQVDIANYLFKIEKDWMGLTHTPDETRNRVLNIAKILLESREWIIEESS
jgi:hypothetical protein